MFVQMLIEHLQSRTVFWVYSLYLQLLKDFVIPVSSLWPKMLFESVQQLFQTV